MLRVRDLERSLFFYVNTLGMRLMRRADYQQGRFTLAFVGYGDELTHAVIELTHNWDTGDYEMGSAYGHIALAVTDLQAACAQLRAAGIQILREPGPMKHRLGDGASPDHIAFIADPDGYRIELIQKEP
jgi:lactoylglutathione lyase